MTRRQMMAYGFVLCLLTSGLRSLMAEVAVQPGSPMIAFAGGEIARHHLYGYTRVLTVFTDGA